MWHWVIALGVSILISGCGGVMGGSAARPMKTYVVSTEGASVYRTDSTNPSDEPTSQVGAIRKRIETIAFNANAPIQPDGRLDALAEWMLENTPSLQQSPPIDAIEFATRHWGIPEPTPRLFLTKVSDIAIAAQNIADSITKILDGESYTHFGIATRNREESTFIAIAFSKRCFQMANVPRRIETKEVLRLKGKLNSGYRNPSMTVTQPDGTSLHKKEGRGPRFDFSIPSEQIGVYRVELLAEGIHGATVLANFPVYVGVPVPHQASVVDNSGQKVSTDRAQFIRELLRLINETRRQHGLKPLKIHAELSEVAQAHCVDMDQNGFIGHHSPTTGDMADRVDRAGIRSPEVRENIGKGNSAEIVHAGLMRSPAHRDNILSPSVTHVGIGVVVQKKLQESQFLVTELFIRVIDNIDIDDAPDEVLDMINDVRAARDLDDVDSDDALAAPAQRAASMYFEQPKMTVQKLASYLQEQLGSTASRFKRVTILPIYVNSLEDAKVDDRLLDPSVRTVGIGVAQGSRKGDMPNTILIVVVMASPR